MANHNARAVPHCTTTHTAQHNAPRSMANHNVRAVAQCTTTHTARNHNVATSQHQKITGQRIRNLIAPMEARVHDTHGRNARHNQGSTMDSNNFQRALVLQRSSWYDQRTVARCTNHAHGTHGTSNVQRWIPTISHVRWCSKGGLGNPNARWHPHDEFDTTRYRAPGHANTPPPPNIQQNFDRVPESAVLADRIPTHFHETAQKSTKRSNMVALREVTTGLDAARQDHRRSATNARVHVCTCHPTKQRRKIKGHRTRLRP